MRTHTPTHPSRFFSFAFTSIFHLEMLNQKSTWTTSFTPPSSFTIRHRGFKQLAKRFETSFHTTMQTRSITTHSTRDIYSMNANAPWISKGHLLVSSFFVEQLTNGIQQRHQKPSLVGFPKPCKNPFRGIRNKGIKRIRSTLPRENDVFANHINFS